METFERNGHIIEGNINMEKTCVLCNQTFNQANFYMGTFSDSKLNIKKLNNRCKDCVNKEKGITKKLKKNYKHLKGDSCDLCGVKTKLDLDHDHKTKKFRGWLCRSCNMGIGRCGDTVNGIQNLINYLIKNEKNST
jgi:hypothetical protein